MLAASPLLPGLLAHRSWHILHLRPRRNDFDRLVHLSCGLVWVRPFAQAMQRHSGLSRCVGVAMALLFIGAFSGSSNGR